MFLKIMSNEHNLADGNPLKKFTLLSGVTTVAFHRYTEQPDEPSESAAQGDAYALVEFDREVTWPIQIGIPGYAYVLNDEGKTIERFGSLVRHGLPDTVSTKRT